MDNLGYFTKRMLITDSLHNREIDSPFNKQDIIAYARAEAEDGYFNASYSALDGFENDVFFIGKPEIDPETLKQNSDISQKGLIGKINDGMTDYYIKIGLFLLGGYWLMLQIKKGVK